MSIKSIVLLWYTVCNSVQIVSVKAGLRRNYLKCSGLIRFICKRSTHQTLFQFQRESWPEVALLPVNTVICRAFKEPISPTIKPDRQSRCFWSRPQSELDWKDHRIQSPTGRALKLVDFLFSVHAVFMQSVSKAFSCHAWGEESVRNTLTWSQFQIS